MPATIVETNTKKFKRKDIDPITLDIIENAMMNARYEMDAVVFRTAMSPGIREQNDMFPMIANLEGKMVVVSSVALSTALKRPTTAPSKRVTCS